MEMRLMNPATHDGADALETSRCRSSPYRETLGFDRQFPTPIRGLHERFLLGLAIADVVTSLLPVSPSLSGRHVSPSAGLKAGNSSNGRRATRRRTAALLRSKRVIRCLYSGRRDRARQLPCAPSIYSEPTATQQRPPSGRLDVTFALDHRDAVAAYQRIARTRMSADRSRPESAHITARRGTRRRRSSEACAPKASRPRTRRKPRPTTSATT